MFDLKTHWIEKPIGLKNQENLKIKRIEISISSDKLV